MLPSWLIAAIVQTKLDFMHQVHNIGNKSKSVSLVQAEEAAL